MLREKIALSIKESTFRMVLSISAPLLLAAIAVVTWQATGPLWVVIVLVAVSVILALFVLFDFALSIELTDTGIVRRCPARTHEIEWGDIAKLAHPRRRGLVAVTESGRHHILIDRKLEASELDVLGTQARLHQVGFDS